MTDIKKELMLNRVAKISLGSIIMRLEDEIIEESRIYDINDLFNKLVEKWIDYIHKN
uniref:Uncharacterized protein n=1 Tax=viral metagenome TaxID=1070528 RepID=A0A6H1ZRI5_9ZZZZ